MGSQLFFLETGLDSHIGKSQLFWLFKIPIRVTRINKVTADSGKKALNHNKPKTPAFTNVQAAASQASIINIKFFKVIHSKSYKTMIIKRWNRISNSTIRLTRVLRVVWRFASRNKNTSSSNTIHKTMVPILNKSSRGWSTATSTKRSPISWRRKNKAMQAHTTQVIKAIWADHRHVLV